MTAPRPHPVRHVWTGPCADGPAWPYDGMNGHYPYFQLLPDIRSMQVVTLPGDEDRVHDEKQRVREVVYLSQDTSGIEEDVSTWRQT